MLLKQFYWSNYVGVAFFLISSCVCGTGVCGDSELKLVSEEYPKALINLENMYKDVKGVFILDVSPRRGVKSRKRGDFAISNGYGKVLLSTLLPKPVANQPTDFLICNLPESSYVILRQNKNTPWAITDLDSYSEMNRPFLSRGARFALCPFTIQGVPITKFMKNQNFRFDSAEWIEFQGAQCLKVEVNIDYPRPQSHATLVLDRANGWVIRRLEYMTDERAPSGRLIVDITYGNKLNSMVASSLNLTDFNGSKIACDIEAIKFEATPSNEFSLQHFGLPAYPTAPVPGTGQSTSAYWLIGASIFGMFLAGGLKRWIKYRSDYSR